MSNNPSPFIPHCLLPRCRRAKACRAGAQKLCQGRAAFRASLFERLVWLSEASFELGDTVVMERYQGKLLNCAGFENYRVITDNQIMGKFVKKESSDD